MAKIVAGETDITRIAYHDAAPAPVRLAAEELAAYLEAATGVRLPDGPGARGEAAFFLSVGAPSEFEDSSYDRCTVVVRNGRVDVRGENPRSVLYAVYDFLQERLGVRFFGPGPSHEHVPTTNGLTLAEGYMLASGSPFAYRDYGTNCVATIDFFVKNRGNTVMCAHDGEAADAVRKRGALLRGPGHAWRDFVPDQGLLDEHPEYFPMIDGRRAPNGRTACFSNPEVRRIFMANLRAYLREHPHWDIFAFWAEDIADRCYCGCEECSKMSLADWYLTLVNEAAPIVAEELPNAVFEFIAYHGTRRPPGQIGELWGNGRRMLLNLCLGYTRDIYHPLTDRTYGSAEVVEMCEQWHDWLRRVGFEGDMLVMDYVNLCEAPNQGPRGRALLWPMDVMRHDTSFYLAEGLAGVGNWFCFDRLCWPTPFAIWSWLQLWKDPEKTIEELKDNFYPTYFGPSGAAVRDYVDRLEARMHAPTSPANVESVRTLGNEIGTVWPRGDDERLADRLQVVKTHYAYCVLLKEIWSAFQSNDVQRWSQLEKPFRAFFEETHRELLEGEIDIPPTWAYTWYEWRVERGDVKSLVNDPSLH